MNLYTCTDHDCHWPVGVASIILAHNDGEARFLLDAELKKHGLKDYKQSNYSLQKVSQATPIAIVLRDGDY